MPITLTRLSTEKHLDTLAADWERLSADNPFCGWDWMRTWWTHYGHSAELFVLAGYNSSGRLVAVAPWMMNRSMSRGATIKLMGSGEVCTDYVSLIAEPDCLAPFAHAVADWLVASTQSSEAADRWDGIDLDGVLDTHVSIGAMCRRLGDQSMQVVSQAGPHCWRIALPASWDEYVATLSKSHRKQVRRVQRRLLDSRQTALHTVRSPDELPRGLEILVDLHQRRRRSLGEAGCFSSHRFSSFLADISRRLLDRGELRLHWVEFEGQPVAAEFQLVRGAVRYAYQAGIEPDRMDLEPGRLIQIATIRHAIDEGQTCFDLLRGDEPYKAHWRAHPTGTTRWRIASNGALAQLRHNVWLAGATLKAKFTGSGAAAPTCE